MPVATESASLIGAGLPIDSMTVTIRFRSRNDITAIPPVEYSLPAGGTIRFVRMGNTLAAK